MSNKPQQQKCIALRSLLFFSRYLLLPCQVKRHWPRRILSRYAWFGISAYYFIYLFFSNLTCSSLLANTCDLNHASLQNFQF